MNRPNLSTRWIAAATLALTCNLPAQPAPASKPESEDAIVRLSEFEVSSQRDTAYRANSAVSSNRANTPLFETPQSITVLTEAFLRDIEALSVAEALEFIPGVTPWDAGAGGADTVAPSVSRYSRAAASRSGTTIAT